MNLEIHSWYGRLGNNIMQLCNMLLVAKKKRYNIGHIPEHPLLNIGRIPKKWLINSNNVYTKTLKGRFFKTSEINKILGTDLIKFKVDDYVVVLKDVIYKILKSECVPTSPLSHNTLVIHVRSGDCFRENKTKPHPDYIPLPVSYYIKCINDCYSKNEISHIIIVTENDKINPVISHIEHYVANVYNTTTVTVQSTTIENDMKTILSARHLILSIGYFSKLLGLLSQHLEQIWISDYLFDYEDFLNLNNVNVKLYQLNEYTKIGEWIDTPEQRLTILSHPIDNIVELV